VWVYHGDEVPHREQQTERALARAHASAQQVETSGRGGAAAASQPAAEPAVPAPEPVADAPEPVAETPEAPAVADTAAPQPAPAEGGEA
jgi:hypothetical protein